MAGETQRRRIRALLARAGQPGLDVAGVEAAFVHESAASESPALRSNERLEFLGDAVLGAIVCEWLFERYPNASEGELARRKAALVCDEALGETARRLGFGDLLVLGRGQRRSGGATLRSILAGSFEAFVAALYRTEGLDAAKRFIREQHLAAFEGAGPPATDPKTALQELAQRLFRSTPAYEENAEGSAQAPAFVARVSVGGRILASGRGSSKKAAQQVAAAEALALLSESQPT